MITPEDRTAIANDVLWRLVDFRPTDNRNLWDHAIETTKQQFALRGEIAGLTTALSQVTSGQPVDLDAIRAAARDGAASAVTSIETTVTVRSDDGLRDALGV